MVNYPLLHIFLVLVYHGLIQLYSETSPILSKHLEIHRFQVALGDLHAKNGNFFCEGTLGMANPQPFMQYVLTLYCQTLIPRTKTHTHTYSPISQCVGVLGFWGNSIAVDFNCTC